MAASLFSLAGRLSPEDLGNQKKLARFLSDSISRFSSAPFRRLGERTLFFSFIPSKIMLVFAGMFSLV